MKLFRKFCSIVNVGQQPKRTGAPGSGKKDG